MTRGAGIRDEVLATRQSRHKQSTRDFHTSYYARLAISVPAERKISPLITTRSRLAEQETKEHSGREETVAHSAEFSKRGTRPLAHDNVADRRGHAASSRLYQLCAAGERLSLPGYALGGWQWLMDPVGAFRCFSSSASSSLP